MPCTGPHHAGNKERLLLRTAPKGNPRSTLFALPQPESRRGAQLRQVSVVIPPPGGPGVRIPYPPAGSHSLQVDFPMTGRKPRFARQCMRELGRQNAGANHNLGRLGSSSLSGIDPVPSGKTSAFGNDTRTAIATAARDSLAWVFGISVQAPGAARSSRAADRVG
jgi:hypothetical protein